MANANKPATPTPGQTPTGFAYPLKRIVMEERNDDSLACIATLTNQSLPDIKKLAVQLGLPAQGPYWVLPPLMTKLCYQYNLLCGDYKNVEDVTALPELCILLVDYDPETEIGRHVVWHHVKAAGDKPALTYVIDPAPWLPVEQQVTSDFSHLQMKPPLYYIAITQRRDTSAAKGKVASAL